MIVPTVPFDTSKHCACETPRPATFTDRCLTCGGMRSGHGHLFELPEAKAGPAKASDERLTWSLDALAFLMGQTFKRPTVEFERDELVRRAKELGLLGEERP